MIVSSQITQNNLQIDSRRAIVELCIDDQGISYTANYMADAGADLNAHLAATVAALEIQIAGAKAQAIQNEINNNVTAVMTIGSLAVPVILLSTPTANVIAFRAAYKTATQLQAIMMGDFLNAQSDAALQVAFSLNAGQVATLRTTTLQPAAAQAAIVRASVGA